MTSFEPGGTERQMGELVRRLNRDRFAVHVACFRPTGAWLPRISEDVASVVHFPIQGFARAATLHQLARFARWCRRERIAVVHTADFYANVFGLPGAFLGGVPVRIGNRRELNPDKSPTQIRLQKIAYRFATRVVANSPAAIAILHDEGVPAARTMLVANGIDASAYAAPRRSGPVRTVITVANLRPEKNHETLIAAAAMLAPAYPDLRFQIVGDGARRHELGEFARARGVDHAIEFLGHREDVPALLARADIFVLPSRSEACPNGAIEAMAAGLPVVASAVGGLLDLVKPGSTGLLFDVGDAAALAAALKSLVDEPERARSMGAAAQEEIVSLYSFDRMVHSFETLYESQLGARGPLRPQAAQAGI